ncbi:MAG: SynChlorMet cassette protein ScmD [Clostridia bacterium]|jgi:hypothetical protein|nr:SynChlorMet cassette protein ScmD [Clostridia bacterium]
MMIHNKQNEDNFMLYIPVKSHSNYIQKDNVVYLAFRHVSLIERFAAWLTRKPTIRDIRLDSLCIRVWQLIDGNNSVYRIGQILSKENAEHCKHIDSRLKAYLKYLNKRGWIKFKLSSKAKNISLNKA